MSAPAAASTAAAAAVEQVTQSAAALQLDASAADTKPASSSEQPTANAEGDESSGDDEAEGEGGAAGADKKKKKKRKNKKKKPAVPVNACGVHLFSQGPRVAPTPAPASLINANKAVKHRVQLSPVSIPIADCFQNRVFPEGQIMQQPGEFNTFRIGSEEKRASERHYTDMLSDLREAAEVHREVRADFMRWVKPGMSMIDIAQYIERGTKAGLKAGDDRLKRGWGFPTGVSLNHCAAHYTPNYKDTTVLRESDVMKVDFGTHINGHIIDSAFTVAFDPKFDPLLNAVQEATNCGLAAAGVDVRLCDIGAAIQEVMESHEIELNGVTHPIKCIRNLNGHNIAPYKIHGGKSVPIVRNQDQTKMEEGELYAIETFGSTGRGHVLDDGECSHYMKNYEDEFRPLRTKAAKDLLRHIDAHHGTLAFARRWIDDEGCKGYMGGLKELVDADVVRACPPLYDVKGSYTAQFEHTFLLRPTCKEILSRGDDY